MTRKPHVPDHRNHYVDDGDGRTYRVCIHNCGRVLVVCRRDHAGHDTGPNLDPEGAKGRKLVAKAKEQA